MLYEYDDNGKRDSKNEDCWKEDSNGDMTIELVYFRQYGQCQKCPDNILYLLAAFVAAFAVAAFIGWQLHKKKVDLGIVSIGIDYFQVLAIFANTEITWPWSIQIAFNWLSIFNFSLNLTPPECAFEVTCKCTRISPHSNAPSTPSKPALISDWKLRLRLNFS